ncbi:MAG: hypothetical protein BWX61_00831 [Bacteroidetes bacterium ADurb.Bin035]|nr:MAG: hypothetical protein BWX61_00831 [Bacteroidetes bacterium ADurb.Bin035]
MRYPVFRIRVYPPGLFTTLGAISSNNIFTASLFCNLAKANLLLAVLSFLVRVIIGSINFRNSFALGTVVFILLCFINAIDKFFNNALR